MQPSQPLSITPFHSFGVRTNLHNSIHRTRNGIVIFASGSRVGLIMPKDSPRGGESMHSDPLFQGTFYEPNIYFFPRSTDSKDLCAFDVRERVDERNFSKRNDIRVAIAENTETWVEEEGTKQKKRILSNVSIFDASDAPAIYTRKTIVFNGNVTALAFGPEEYILVAYEVEQSKGKAFYMEIIDMNYSRSIISEEIGSVDRDDPSIAAKLGKICIVHEDPLIFFVFGSSVKHMQPKNCHQSNRRQYPVYRTSFLLSGWKFTTVPSIRYEQILLVPELNRNDRKAAPALVDIIACEDRKLLAVDANRIIWTVKIHDLECETSLEDELEVPVVYPHLPAETTAGTVNSEPYIISSCSTESGFIVGDSQSNIIAYQKSNDNDKGSMWASLGYVRLAMSKELENLNKQTIPLGLSFSSSDCRLVVTTGFPIPSWTTTCLDDGSLPKIFPRLMSELIDASNDEFESYALKEYERKSLPSPFESSRSSKHFVYSGAGIGILPVDLVKCPRNDMLRTVEPRWIIEEAHTGRINSLSMPSTCGSSIQTRYFASCSRDDGSVKVWDMVMRRHLLSKTFPWPSSPVCVSLHPSGFFLSVGFPGRLQLFAIVFDSPHVDEDDSDKDFTEKREDELKNLTSFQEVEETAKRQWNDDLLRWNVHSSSILSTDLLHMSSLELNGIRQIQWSSAGDKLAVAVNDKVYVYFFLRHSPSLYLEDFASAVVGKEFQFLGRRGNMKNTLHKQDFPFFQLIGILDCSRRAVADICFGQLDQYLFATCVDTTQYIFDLNDTASYASGYIEVENSQEVDLRRAGRDLIDDRFRSWFDDSLSPVVSAVSEHVPERNGKQYLSNSIFIGIPPWGIDDSNSSLQRERSDQKTEHKTEKLRGVIVTHTHNPVENSNVTYAFVDDKLRKSSRREHVNASANSRTVGICYSICGVSMPYIVGNKESFAPHRPPFTVALWGGTDDGSIVQLGYPGTFLSSKKSMDGISRRASLDSAENNPSMKNTWTSQGIKQAEKCHSPKPFCSLSHVNAKYVSHRTPFGVAKLSCTEDGTFIVSVGCDGSIFLYLVDAIASARWERLEVPVRSPVAASVGIQDGATKEELSSRLRTSYRAALLRWQKGIYALSAGFRKLKKGTATPTQTSLVNIDNLLQSEEYFAMVSYTTFKEWESWLFRLRSGNNRLQHDFDKSLEQIRADYNNHLAAAKRRYDEKLHDLNRDSEMNRVQLEHSINELKSKISSIQQEGDARERNHELEFQGKLSGAQETIEKLLDMVNEQQKKTIEGIQASKKTAEQQQKTLVEDFKGKVKEQAKEIERLKSEIGFNKEQTQHFIDELEQTNDDEILRFRALLDKAAKDTKQARSQAHRDIAVLKGTLSSAKAAEKEAEEARSIEAASRKENAAQVEKLTERLIELQRENQQLHVSLRSRDQQLAHSEVKRRELESERDNLQVQVFDLRSKLEPTERDLSMLRQHIRDLNDELSKVSEDQKQKDHVIEQARRQRKSLLKQKDALEKDITSIVSFTKRFQTRLCEFEDNMPFTTSEWEYVFRALYDEFVLSIPILSSQMSAFETAKALRQRSTGDGSSTELLTAPSPALSILRRKAQSVSHEKEVETISKYLEDTTALEHGKTAGAWVSQSLRESKTEISNSKQRSTQASTKAPESENARGSPARETLPSIYDSLVRGATELNRQRQNLFHNREIMDKTVKNKEKTFSVQQRKMVDENVNLLEQLNMTNHENAQLKEKINELKKQLEEKSETGSQA